MKNKVAFLMPIYPPHYGYCKEAISSFKNNNLDKQADFWLVFTHEDEAQAFGEYENKIVLPENLREFRNRGIINIKKIYGLSQLKELYEYVLVVDSEISFIRDINIYDLCNKYFERKILLGNQATISKTASLIQDSNKIFFANANNKELIDTQLYLWFNQPCFYKMAHFDEFYEIIGGIDGLKCLCWSNFDYYMYMYYLILFHNFKIKNLEAMADCGVLENREPIEVDSRYLPFIMMCSVNMRENVDNENLFMIIHLDRIKTGKSKLYKFFHLYWLRGIKDD